MILLQNFNTTYDDLNYVRNILLKLYFIVVISNSRIFNK